VKYLLYIWKKALPINQCFKIGKYLFDIKQIQPV
jgi:hypothetical protein